MKKTVCSLALAMGILCPLLHSQIISDGFSRSGGLNGTSADVGGTWDANANWSTDGTSAAPDYTGVTSPSGRNGYQSFTPVIGSVYELSADLSLVGNGNGWLAVGFASNTALGNNFAANDIAFWLWKPNDDIVAHFDNDGTHGGATTSTILNQSGDTGKISMILDTSDANAANWTIEYLFDGNSLHTETWSSATVAQTAVGNITHVGIGAWGTEAGINGSSLDNFTLSNVTVIPEPSTYAAIGGLLSLAMVGIRRRHSR